MKRQVADGRKKFQNVGNKTPLTFDYKQRTDEAEDWEIKQK